MALLTAERDWRVPDAVGERTAIPNRIDGDLRMCTSRELLLERGLEETNVDQLCAKAALAGLGDVPRDIKCPLEHLASLIIFQEQK